MFSKDKLCRSILLPKCVRDGAFDEMSFLQLGDVHRDGSMYALSLASLFILGSESAAHEYGCRTARRSNEAYEIRTGQPPPSEKNTAYIGYYELEYGPLSIVSLEQYWLSIKFRIEHGERAHFQLELTNKGKLGPGRQNDKIRREDRQVAMVAVAALLRGPKRHVCDEEEDNRASLEAFALPLLPLVFDATSVS